MPLIDGTEIIEPVMNLGISLLNPSILPTHLTHIIQILRALPLNLMLLLAKTRCIALMSVDELLRVLDLLFLAIEIFL